MLSPAAPSVQSLDHACTLIRASRVAASTQGIRHGAFCAGRRFPQRRNRRRAANAPCAASAHFAGIVTAPAARVQP